MNVWRLILISTALVIPRWAMLRVFKASSLSVTHGFWCNGSILHWRHQYLCIANYPFCPSNECKCTQMIWLWGLKWSKWHVGCAGPEALNWLLPQCDGWKVGSVFFTPSLFSTHLNHQSSVLVFKCVCVTGLLPFANSLQVTITSLSPSQSTSHHRGFRIDSWIRHNW